MESLYKKVLCFPLYILFYRILVFCFVDGETGFDLFLSFQKCKLSSKKMSLTILHNLSMWYHQDLPMLAGEGGEKDYQDQEGWWGQ